MSRDLFFFRVQVRAQVMAQDARAPVVILGGCFDSKHAICWYAALTPVRDYLWRCAYTVSQLREAPNSFYRALQWFHAWQLYT